MSDFVWKIPLKWKRRNVIPQKGLVDIRTIHGSYQMEYYATEETSFMSVSKVNTEYGFALPANWTAG